MFTDVTNAVITVNGEDYTIENPAGMDESQLISAVLNNLIIPLVGDEPTMKLADLVGKSASAELTISAGLVDYTPPTRWSL